MSVIPSREGQGCSGQLTVWVKGQAPTGPVLGETWLANHRPACSWPQAAEAASLHPSPYPGRDSTDSLPGLDLDTRMDRAGQEHGQLHPSEGPIGPWPRFGQQVQQRPQPIHHRHHLRGHPAVSGPWPTGMGSPPSTPPRLAPQALASPRSLEDGPYPCPSSSQPTCRCQRLVAGQHKQPQACGQSTHRARAAVWTPAGRPQPLSCPGPLPGRLPAPMQQQRRAEATG